jgi:hypothetical protein
LCLTYNFAKLCDSKRDASDGTVEALQKIAPAIRQRFGKKVRIIVRADSGFARESDHGFVRRK